MFEQPSKEEQSHIFRKYIKFEDGRLWIRAGSGWKGLSFLDTLEEMFFVALFSVEMIGLIAVDIVLILLIKALLTGGVS